MSGFRVAKLATLALANGSALVGGVACQRAEAGEVPALVKAALPASSAETKVALPPAPVVAPRVSLSGVGRGASETTGAASKRVFARAARTWIYSAPNTRADRLGYLRA